MMQYHELQQNNMEKAESSGELLHVCSETSFEPCTELFSMRQYVLLSRQKNIFQNWPFPEKYLKLCLEYGITNVLPPLEAQVLLEGTSISYDKGEVTNAGNDHEVSFEATISMESEQLQLMSLSCNGHKPEKENPSDMYNLSDMNMIKAINRSEISARQGKKTRKWRRKMRTMAEIFTSAKHCTSEEVYEMNDLSYTSDIAPDKEGEQRKSFLVDF